MGIHSYFPLVGKLRGEFPDIALAVPVDLGLGEGFKL